jgi:hypothetical protein
MATRTTGASMVRMGSPVRFRRRSAQGHRWGLTPLPRCGPSPGRREDPSGRYPRHPLHWHQPSPTALAITDDGQPSRSTLHPLIRGEHAPGRRWSSTIKRATTAISTPGEERSPLADLLVRLYVGRDRPGKDCASNEKPREIAVRLVASTHRRGLVPSGSLAGVPTRRSGVEALVVGRRWMLRGCSTCRPGRSRPARSGYERGYGSMAAL